MSRALGLAFLLAACAAAPRDDLVQQLLDEEIAPDWSETPAFLAYGEPDPPPDDAPLEDLIEFWTLLDGPLLRIAGVGPEPSPATRRRLGNACRFEPHLVGRLWSYLPDTEWARGLIGGWLRHHDPDGAGEEWLVETIGFRALATTRLRTFAAGEDARLAVAALTELLHRTEIEAERERLRAWLRPIVEDRGAGPRPRRRALQIMVAEEWEGRDAWCVSLLEDETLSDVLGAGIRVPDANHWIPIMAPYVGHEDRAVHANAVAFLLGLDSPPSFAPLTVDWDRAQALRPLLPWLEDPAWASIGGRARFVRQLGSVDSPDVVPALIRILEREEDDETVLAAVKAVADQGDPRAVPALKRLLRKGGLNDWVLPALLECGGISRREQLDAIEAYVRVQHLRGGTVVAAWRLEEQIGYRALQYGADDDAFNAALLRRARGLPQLVEIVHGRAGAVADRDIVRRLREGTLTFAGLGIALGRREEVAEHAETDLRETLRLGGARGGFAAALLNEPGSVLAGDDRAAQRALLASARWMRLPLPIDDVARLLPDRSAELYLRSEDGPEARKLLPGRILGFEPWESVDQQVLALLDAKPAVREIRALFSRGPDGEVGRVVLVYEDRMELRWFAPSAPVRVRELAGDEGRRLMDFLDRHRVDDLGPLERHIDGGIEYYYLHVTRKGGRRVFIDNPTRDEGLYAVLVRKFERLTEKGDFTAR